MASRILCLEPASAGPEDFTDAQLVAAAGGAGQRLLAAHPAHYAKGLDDLFSFAASQSLSRALLQG